MELAGIAKAVGRLMMSFGRTSDKIRGCDVEEGSGFHLKAELAAMPTLVRPLSTAGMT